MNKLAAILIALTTTLSAQAFRMPDGPYVTKRTTLTDVSNVGHSQLRGRVQGGDLAVMSDNEVILHLDLAPDASDAADVSRTVVLPIVSELRDICGVITITAERDQTPVDGLRQTIVLRDFTQTHCGMPNDRATEIEYSTFNPWTQTEEVSKFRAEPLSRIYYAM